MNLDRSILRSGHRPPHHPPATGESPTFQMNMNTPASFPGNPHGSLPTELQPSRLQFIQQTFPELTGELGGGRSRMEWFRWVHDRLFIDGWQLNAVRAELVRGKSAVQVIAATSGKGGVGKTTFAVNLSIAFAQRGKRVLLFDADLGMANVHVFAGVNPTATVLDVIDGVVQVEGPGPKGHFELCFVNVDGSVDLLKGRTVGLLHELVSPVPVASYSVPGNSSR